MNSVTFERVGDPMRVVSHVRSGTHLLIDTLRGSFSDCVSWKWPGGASDAVVPCRHIGATIWWVRPLAGGGSDELHGVAVGPVGRIHWTLPDFSNLTPNPVYSEVTRNR